MDTKEPELHNHILLASLEFAKQIGSELVVVHPGRFIPESEFGLFPVRDLTHKEKFALLEQEAQYLQSAASQFPDITIALENARPYLNQSPYCYAETLSPLKQQIETINKKNIGINIDEIVKSRLSN